MAIARHQLAVALTLGCEKIIALCGPTSEEADLIQPVAERAGASFHRASGLYAVLGHVTATDEVFALADGLLAWPDLATELLSAGQGVLVQPIEIGLPLGYERIDINHAAAGAMRVPGWLLERMTQLPGDCDVFSTLQRVALQHALPMRPLPAEAEEAGRWVLLRSEAEANAIEPGWIALHTPMPRHASPAVALATLGVRKLGPALLHAGSSGTVIAIAAGVVAALALMLGWFGYVWLGLGLSALTWVWFQSAAMFGRVERTALRLARPRLAPSVTYGWLMDGVLLLLLSRSQPSVAGAGLIVGLWSHAFAPLMLLGLVRLVPRLVGGEWAPWLEDRALLAMGLCVAALAGVLAPVLGLIALALVIVGIAATDPQG